MSPKVEPSLRIGLTLLMSQTMKKKRATKYHKKIAVAFSAMEPPLNKLHDYPRGSSR